jgi:hypothetical protein
MPECDRCGGDADGESWGTTLYDDHVGLTFNHGVGITLCASCRDEFEGWVQGASDD